MYLVIGKKHCGQCTIVKDILTKKGIAYEYKLVEELPEEEYEKYVAMAEKAKQTSFPLIIKDDKLVSLQEV